jgi:O-antigen biosynthesis protein
MTSIKRALVCAPLLPEFDRESGSRRIYDTLMFLQELGWAVTFIAQNGRNGERYVRHLQQRGICTYCGFDKRTELLMAAGGFQLAVFAFWYLAEEYLPLLRRLSPDTRIVIDTIDLHFMRNARRILQPLSSDPSAGLGAEYADEMRRELNTYASADGVLAVSHKETDLINDFTGDSTLAATVPDSEDLSPSQVPFDDRKGILFIGNFRHPPNVGAVEYLCREIVPRVDDKLLSEHPLYVVGNGMDAKIRSLAATLPQVQMIGWVPSVIPYLERLRISVVPLLYGAGTKRKLVQALMVGTPTVSTSVGIEGLGLVDQRHALVADDAQSFAEAIQRLLTDRTLWVQIAEQGRSRIVQGHSREAARDYLRLAIERFLAKKPKGPSPSKHASAPSSGANGAYDDLVAALRHKTETLVPPDSTILVITKGDDRLLEMDQRQGWHFPQNESREYAGHYPVSSDNVIAHLEALRSQGAQYLLIPSPYLWWLSHYEGFQQHLDSRYRLILRDDDWGALYSL